MKTDYEDADSIRTYGNATAVICKEIRERIMRGDLLGGAPINIQSVARSMDVSIIPVREAIRTLAAEGLVDVLPRRSPVVRSVSLVEALEISDIRLANEPLALSRAIPMMTEDAISTAKATLERYSTETDPWIKARMNKAFHMSLYQPCQMKRLLGIIEVQYDGIAQVAHFRLIEQNQVPRRSDEEHAAILRACERGDVELAVGLLREHISGSRRRIAQVL